MIICAVLNVHRSKQDGAIEPQEVMPWLKEEQPEEKKQRSPRELRELFEQLTRDMGGIVHPRNQPLAGS